MSQLLSRGISVSRGSNRYPLSHLQCIQCLFWPGAAGRRLGFRCRRCLRDRALTGNSFPTGGTSILETGAPATSEAITSVAFRGASMGPVDDDVPVNDLTAMISFSIGTKNAL